VKLIRPVAGWPMIGEWRLRVPRKRRRLLARATTLELAAIGDAATLDLDRHVDRMEEQQIAVAKQVDRTPPIQAPE